MADSFATRAHLDVNRKSYAYPSLPKLGERFDLARLSYSMKILLENLRRHEHGVTVLPAHIEAVAKWDPKAEPDTEIAFMPARLLLQDFTGVPCVVDLAAMRDWVTRLGGNPKQINPLIPSELVIDHSVQVDVFGRADAHRGERLRITRSGRSGICKPSTGQFPFVLTWGGVVRRVATAFDCPLGWPVRVVTSDGTSKSGGQAVRSMKSAIKRSHGSGA